MPRFGCILPILDGAARHLAPSGRAVITHNSFVDLARTHRRLAQQGFAARIVRTVMLALGSLGAYGLQDAPAFRSAEHDVLKQHREEPEREASRCLVRAAVPVCPG